MQKSIIKSNWNLKKYVLYKSSKNVQLTKTSFDAFITNKHKNIKQITHLWPFGFLFIKFNSKWLLSCSREGKLKDIQKSAKLLILLSYFNGCFFINLNGQIAIIYYGYYHHHYYNFLWLFFVYFFQYFCMRFFIYLQLFWYFASIAKNILN